MCKLIITGYVKNKKPFVKDMLRYVYVYIYVYVTLCILYLKSIHKNSL